jgi:hypothetical protein
MNLRRIVADLDRKRLSARAIQNDIVTTRRLNIVGSNTVTRYLHETKFPLSAEEPPMPTIERLSTKPMKPSCPLSTRVHLRLCGSSRDSPTPSNDRLPSPDSIPGVHRASSSSGAPGSVRRAESSANDSVSATIVNAGVQHDRSWHDIVTLEES